MGRRRAATAVVVAAVAWHAAMAQSPTMSATATHSATGTPVVATPGLLAYTLHSEYNVSSNGWNYTLVVRGRAAYSWPCVWCQRVPPPAASLSRAALPV